ncbi:MAG: 2-oxoacid:acceptor oxidoreductase subunit alpha [Patescibacteria group bacterium]
MKSKVNTFTWTIGGAAGDGIMVTGAMLAKYCTRAGLWTTDYAEYPSLIRGGHNVQVVQVDEEQIFEHDQGTEILVAINEETVRLHAASLSPGGALVYDSTRLTINPAMIGDRTDIVLVPVPLMDLALKNGGKDLMRNTVALGATLALLQAPRKLMDDIFQDTFGAKGQKVVDINVATCRAGYEHVQKLVKDFPWRIVPKENDQRMVIGGNDALSLGFIHGGLKFYAAYPMTPASSILISLAELAPTYKHITKHAEDEIAAVNLAIGASFAGVRAACGTSGGGFCLMTEGLGMAAITETPLVIVDAQRPGPATGLPTWTEQGDLRFVMHAGQGEFPRVIVAPADPTQAFQEAARSLHIAEHGQLPVIILTDKYLAESHWSTPMFDLTKLRVQRGGFVTAQEHGGGPWYQRYADTVTGITPRPIPGQSGGVFIANSDEHDAVGHANEESDNRVMQYRKRERKLEAVLSFLPPRLVHYGPDDADVTFVTWGSVTQSCKEAMRKLATMGIRANVLQVLYLLPFPVAEVQQFFRAAKKTILVENNGTAQLGGVLKEYADVTCNHQLLKNDGRPFWAEDIAAFAKGHM